MLTKEDFQNMLASVSRAMGTQHNRELEEKLRSRVVIFFAGQSGGFAL